MAQVSITAQVRTTNGKVVAASAIFKVEPLVWNVLDPADAPIKSDAVPCGGLHEVHMANSESMWGFVMPVLPITTWDRIKYVFGRWP